ncbi:MAG: tetratricopeptide repeat protein [Flavobacteriales bacterium]|nr:tetratricopeptide repeat protein [Flavobacteriales bacterium]
MICMIRILRTLVLLAFLLPSMVYGQSKKDSLLHVLSSSGFSDSLCNDLIWVYVFNQPDSAIYFGNRGLDWAKAHEKEKFLGTLYNRIGVAYDVKSIPDSALYWYNLALNQARKRGNLQTEGGALNNIGLIYWNNGELDKAIDHYIRAAQKFEQIGNLMGLGNTYNNIGIILFEDNQIEKSMRYYRQALKIRFKTGHKTGIAATYINISQLYAKDYLNNSDSSIHYVLSAIPLYKEVNDLYGLSRAYRELADNYAGVDRYNDALVAYRQALSIQVGLGNSEGYASTYYNIAGIYKKLRDPKNELAYLDSAQILAERNKDLSLLWKVYRTKARTFGRIGRHEDAYPYWIAYDNLKDSLVNAERSLQVEELETQYRTAQKDREIADKKTALAEARLKLENRTKWIFGLLGGLASFLLLAFALFQVYRRKTQADKDAAIIAERERGLQAMIQATEEERKRIAKDLHDGIVQSLTGLSLRLQKGFSMVEEPSEELKSRYRESNTMLNESIAELRNISHQMMPRVLSDMGLIPALQDMLEKSLGSTDIQYEFEHHKVEGERFPENLEVSLYRICQELVNNIIKHSDAKAVSVQLLKTASHLVLVVEDNGKGFTFDSPENSNGIGLMNISSRAKALKGEVNYEPSPEHGTVATIRIPLP